MEVFTLIIARKVKECKYFKYYFGCKDLSLTHMCFANDLLVICHGDVKSVKDAGGSLSSIITRRDVYDARLKDNTTVVRMIDNNCWSWPNGWCDRYPMLNNIHVPLLKANEDDKVQWVKGNRESSKFSVKLRIMYGWIGGVIAVMCHGGMLFGSLKTTQDMPSFYGYPFRKGFILKIE
ncbi:hypothetical protein Tco_0468233 [Tanacetum coccineum]